MPLHTSSYLMKFMIQSLQRDLGERIHKLGSSSLGIRVEHISRCGWKFGKQLIEKNFNIASRVVRHVRPQHNCILNSSFTFILFNFLFIFAFLNSIYFFLLIFIILPFLCLIN